MNPFVTTAVSSQREQPLPNMSEYYSPRPALISNPTQGIVFNYPNKAATAKINTPSVTVFQTADPVLFSPLTDGLFEKVCVTLHLNNSVVRPPHVRGRVEL